MDFQSYRLGDILPPHLTGDDQISPSVIPRVMALTWASATSLKSTMLICIGITKGISLLSSIIRNGGLPFRCLFDRGGPRTTQGLIVPS
ncbi:MAG: hypothetical protein Ct9H90mP21_2690 [Methanobacteriota archaeon]|nr:MAG: hypothetical protein Ct9H90mP21_2690 [Euryarchaeota archaeon]